MADSKPINWAYPFKSKAAAEGETSPGSVTAESYYDALAKAKDGFYPMGANGLWHGGIHFDDGTAASLDQSAIHCIADGEVIAYRIDQRYPTTQYGEGPTVVHLPFSTGFVLVKHRLELPSVPAPSAPAEDAGETEEAAPAATTPTAAPASSALTFYSLYMHLADWASYSNADAPTPPAFFGETLYSVKTDKASDGVLGLRVRAAPKDGAVTALLPKGTKVKVGDANADSPAWRKLLSILEGSAIPALAGEELGWVYINEMQALVSEPDTFLVADDANDAEPTLAPQTGLNIRKTGNGKSSDPKIGLLPVGAKCSLKAGTAAYRELLQIVEGQDIAPLSANSVHNIQGFVHFASLQASQAVPTLDSVHLLPQPYSIKAGELVGHLGKYQNFDDARPRAMLHLEVFTSEDVPAFIAQSRAIGEKLPDEQKTLIKVDKGSKIIQPAAADGQIETGADVRICSDSPKAGRWAKVRKYAICNADKNTELGRYNNTDSTYPLSTTQKATLAARMGIDVAEMPDQVDFLKVYFNSVEGGDAHDYDTGTIPTTHPWRKVGAAVGEPVWVERSNLNAQGQRTSTAGALAAWNEFPLHTRIEGQACGYERILPAGSWDGLPNERKAIDPDKVQWWYVTVGDVNGNDISGWAPEKDLIVSRHSPWEWPGFSTIQDKLPLDAHLARTLDATGRATQEETQSYAALIEEAERGEILSKLYDVIDLPDEKGSRDNKLTPAELKTALGKPWLAQQLSLLISQHESEWFWNEGKWNQLDKLMDHTPADPNPNWVAEKGRIKALSWWNALAGQPGIAADGVAWHFQPVGIVDQFFSRDTSDCGCKLGKIFSCVRFIGQTTIYGPLYSGLISLDKYKKWDETIATGVITEEEKKIFIAMSPNEGNIDSIQSYDSEILTVGAMQKTINPSGSGEFPIQVFDFKERYPNLYTSLFENCGWTVKGPRARAKMYYKNSALTEGNEYTGAELKKLIRKDFSEAIFTQKQRIESFPLGAILKAITHEKFQEQQILDFSKRMRSEVLEIKPSGSEYKLKDFLKSPLGKATALDHHINRPGYVSTDFGAALKRFFDKRPSISKSPASWGDKHAAYELEILEDYGKARRMAIVHGTSVAPSRYQHLKEKL